MKHIEFFYFLLTSVTGIVALCVALFAYFKTKAALIRYYLYFYTSFSLLVISGGLLTYIEANIPFIRPEIFNLLHTGTSLFVVFLIVTLPMFVHHLLDVSHARLRNTIFGGIALVMALQQYGTEYDLSGGEFLPDMADYVESAVLVSVLFYTLALALYAARKLDDPLKKAMARKMVFFLGLSMLTVIIDTVLQGRFPIFLFPTLYCSLSIMYTHHFFTYYVHQVPSAAPLRAAESAERVSPEDVFQRYNISPREQEVIGLALRGLSNQQIGDSLYISLSTVKKHISNIYLKLDVKSRYEMIAFFQQPPIVDLPEKNAPAS